VHGNGISSVSATKRAWQRKWRIIMANINEIMKRRHRAMKINNGVIISKIMASISRKIIMAKIMNMAENEWHEIMIMA
jgi:hypothetical protein